MKYIFLIAIIILEISNAYSDVTSPGEYYVTTENLNVRKSPGENGKKINGLDSIGKDLLFHAGTKANGEGIITNGGRVLSVTSLGNSMNEALQQSYQKSFASPWGTRNDTRII